MTDLSPGDFAAYFKAVHGQAPFPWQARLLATLAETGRWPALLELPTGTGKTATIDAAVFHLALDARRPPRERQAPRRIVMVVDRRTIVDQAFERAKRISEALVGAQDGILKRVRDALCSLSGTDEPLALAQLRGGMPRDDGWARRPDQPLVAVSTVDQVGSRLLFRGYGVSDLMRPVHAGLLGEDSLLLLDEVHLSQPFLETLESVRSFRGWTSSGLPDRWQFVAMSATPGKEGTRFGLDHLDLENEVLMRRLKARKPANCVEVQVSGKEEARRTKFAEECAKRGREAARPGRVIGIVVNRVATALQVFQLLREHFSDVHLVTGRMRPLDRDDLDRRLSRRISSGRARTPDAAPVLVVATQCIEAGADYDFDSLITECASLDALRQRFGRLNRLGEIADATATVLIRSDALGQDAEDAVYGTAMAETWRWLGSERDFGVLALGELLPKGEALSRLLPPSTRAPVMLPAHLDAWVQTSVAPFPDPDISLWLHGIDQRPERDVQLVWRADITPELLAAASGDASASAASLEALLARLDVCPPSSLESLAVPSSAVRAWLSGTPPSDVVDVEGRSPETGDDSELPPQLERTALCWRGDESRIVGASDVRPGMTLVVPATYGGLGRQARSWDPANLTPVEDLGDRARWRQTRRPALRLHPRVLGDSCPPPPSLPSQQEEAEQDVAESVREWLDGMAAMAAQLPTWLAEVIGELRASAGRRPALVRVASMAKLPEDRGGYLAVIGRVRKQGRGTEVSTEDDGASHTGVEVTLDTHMKGVRTWVGDFAAHCGLPESVKRDLELAARWHDAGKVDVRFQRLLLGGSPLADIAAEPLAKSRIVAGDRATRALARERSGYPLGARHELSSCALLTAEETLLSSASDRELVLHLVASHHGWCRPFAPAVQDRTPVELQLDIEGKRVMASSAHGLEALDSGVTERFWKLVERYGWFGLAWLEAILRLSDHRRSEQEQQRSGASEELS